MAGENEKNQMPLNSFGLCILSTPIHPSCEIALHRGCGEHAPMTVLHLFDVGPATGSEADPGLRRSSLSPGFINALFPSGYS